jgi:phosphatidyl-myo-inositol dimannoside synthase
MSIARLRRIDRDCPDEDLLRREDGAMNPQVLIAAESLTAGNGGVARLARLTARVLAEEHCEDRLRAWAVTLSDPAPANGICLPIRPMSGSRACFVWSVQRAALRCSHFIYDFLGMARAHCRLPLLRRPFLVWICGIDVWENAPPVRIRTARTADRLVSISHYTRDRAQRTYGCFDRAEICWLGTETDAPAPSPPAHRGRPTVLILGRIDEGGGYKGHRELIACWPKVMSAVPDARLIIAGKGPGLELIQQQAAASPAAAHILFRGFVPEENMNALWAETNVLAMPSRGEGFGFVYIEAMRQGLPVIASVHDAGSEVNLDGHTGYNVNLDHDGELAERLVHLLRNPDHAALLGTQGRAHWHEHFRYSAFRARFLPILREFLSIR